VTEGLDAAALPGSDLLNSQTRIVRYEDTQVEIEAELESPGLLVLTDLFYPGWKVYVDGQLARVYRTDYCFRGVPLPVGRHNVRFEFDPLSFRIGVAITLITLLLLAIGSISLTRPNRGVIVGMLAGIVLIAGGIVDWGEVQRVWGESTAIAAQVTRQLRAQYPSPLAGSQVYFVGVPALPGPAYALSNRFLSPVLFEPLYPGLGVTGGTQEMLLSELTTTPPPWQARPGMVAYWYEDGTLALTPHVFSQLTGNRLVDLQPASPVTTTPVAVFNGWLELHGSAIITQALDADHDRLGGTFLQTNWQLRAPTDRRYTLYVHFTTPDGQLVAQADHALSVWSGRGDVYTNAWPAGVLVRDYVALSPELLDHTPRLDIRVGVWIPETGERLSVTSVTLPVDDNGRLTIGKVGR
jgi:hypothetical protein